MRKMTLAALCAALIGMTSCETSQQFYGTATGAALGGFFGSAIGGLSGGPRGSDAGTIAGMAIGGIIGAAATAPKTSDGNYRSSDYYGQSDSYGTYAYSPYSNIIVEDIRFVDRHNGSYIVAGEHARLAFTIRNTGREYVYDIAPVITVTGTKQIYLSPTAVVSELAPGRAVRYTAELAATRKLKDGVADFAISFSNGNELYTVSTFQLRTRRR